MSQETTVILRAIMLQILKSEDVQEAFEAVKAMCGQDDVAAVMEAYHEWQKQKGIITDKSEK